MTLCYNLSLWQGGEHPPALITRVFSHKTRINSSVRQQQTFQNTGTIICALCTWT